MSKIIFAAGGVVGVALVGLAAYGLMELGSTIGTAWRYRHGPPPLARRTGTLLP